MFEQRERKRKKASEAQRQRLKLGERQRKRERGGLCGGWTPKLKHQTSLAASEVESCISG